MSILLNALKKSEAQRQVGSPPDIHAPVDMTGGRRPTGRRWLSLILLIVSAAIIAWYGWQQYRHADSVEVSGPVEMAESGSVSQQVNPDSKPEQRTVPAAEMLETPTSAPVAVVNFPAKNDQQAAERKQRLTRSFTQFEAESQVDPSAESPAEESPAEDDNLAGMSAETDEFAELESTVSAIAQEENPSRSATTESRRRSSRSGSGSSEPVEPAQESEPISFWQLPQNLRDGMPEFRITVLVYAEQPEDRFLLINGVRLVEKAELAAGITLDEIRRDGAVFSYRNYRFLVKG